MPNSIMHAKIKEALVAAGHNRHDALKLLITWAVRDPALLLVMTKPHLKAIAAGHIDHFVRTDKTGEEPGASSEGFSRAAIDDIISSSLRIPTDKRKNAHLPPPKSTERQASTMRRLAAAFTRKKKDE
jgi:hypothetical protein